MLSDWSCSCRHTQKHHHTCLVEYDKDLMPTRHSVCYKNTPHCSYAIYQPHISVHWSSCIQTETLPLKSQFFFLWLLHNYGKIPSARIFVEMFDYWDLYQTTKKGQELFTASLANMYFASICVLFNQMLPCDSVHNANFKYCILASMLHIKHKQLNTSLVE